MRLGWKILIYILGPLIPIFIILNIFSYIYSCHFLEDQANNMLFAEAETISKAVNMNIENINNELKTIAINKFINDYFIYSGLGLLDNAEDIRWQVEMFFYKITQERSRYSTLRLIKIDGKSVVDINDKKISYKHSNYFSEEWFRRTLKLGDQQTHLYYLAHSITSQGPALIFSMACYSENGKKQGVVAVDYKVVDFFDDLLNKAFITPKIYAYLIDRAGSIIAHKDKNKIGLAVHSFDSTEKILAGTSGVVTELDETNSVLMKKAYLPLGIGGLGLVVAHPQSEILNFSKRLQFGNLVFALLSMLLSSGIIYVGIKKFSRPIIELRNITLEIAQGNFEKRVTVESADEIGQLATSFNEMTYKLKENKENLEKELAERRQAENAYKSLIFDAPIGIYIVQAGRFKIANPGFREITGYSENELFGKISLDIVAPEYRELVRANAVRMLSEESLAPYEFQIICKNGGTKWVVEKVTSHQYQGKRATLGYFMDITEQKQIENQFYQAQKMEAVGCLAGGVAHDFNNLLSAILGYGEMMMMDLNQEHSLYQYTEEIIKAAEWGALLTRQLLAFSRQQVIQPRIINVNEIISNIKPMLQRLIGENIELTAILDPKLGATQADPGQIEQVVMNLAINARDAMPQGGKLTIETTNIYLDEGYTQRHMEVIPGFYMMIAVSDNGIGMNPQIQSRIFEPFFTTKCIGKGTGLGLATVHGIVKQSSGHIWVYSEPGQGTTIKIYLPQINNIDESIQAKKDSVKAQRGWETILAVEDDDALRAVIARALVKFGYKVLEARDGSEALMLCKQLTEPIHLMLTDVIMPNMNGSELSQHLTSLLPQTKVLFMSGHTDDAVVRLGMLDLHVNFIQKPFKVINLTQKVREVLDSPQPSRN